MSLSNVSCLVKIVEWLFVTIPFSHHIPFVKMHVCVHDFNAGFWKNPLTLMDRDHKTNVMGTLNMLGLAKRINARFLLTSTSEVYGDPLEHPQVETYWGNVNPIGESLFFSCFLLMITFHHLLRALGTSMSTSICQTSQLVTECLALIALEYFLQLYYIIIKI